MQNKKVSNQAKPVWWLAAALLAIVTVSAPATAQVIFQREKLTISPPPVTKVSKEEDEKEMPRDDEPTRTPQEFSVEVRGEDALNLEYIHTLNDLKSNDGVLIGFNVPSIVSVPQMKVYTPVDVLFIDEDGIVLQILPKVVPAEINRDIAAAQPVNAFLYIRAGEAKARDIRPKDVVSHGLFNAKPIILK